MNGSEGLPALPLPEGVRSRVVTGVNGLDMHLLEVGAGLFDPRDAGRMVSAVEVVELAPVG